MWLWYRVSLTQPKLLVVIGYAVLFQNLLPLVVQVVQPVGQVALVVLLEGRVHQRQREKLPAPAQVRGVLATSQQHLREKVHVLLHCAGAVRPQ